MADKEKRPKTGGRKKGTPNKISAEFRKEIEKADPIGFLIKIMQGEEMEVGLKIGEAFTVIQTKPTLDQRVTAATKLVNKILPDLKNVEMDAKVTLDPLSKLLKRIQDAGEG